MLRRPLAVEGALGGAEDAEGQAAAEQGTPLRTGSNSTASPSTSVQRSLHSVVVDDGAEPLTLETHISNLMSIRGLHAYAGPAVSEG